MDAAFETEFDRDQLIALVRQLHWENLRLRQQVTDLQRQIEKLGGPQRTQPPEPYSLEAEEKRQAQKQKKKRKQKSPRRGRRKTQDKLDQAERTETVWPEQFPLQECELLCRRPVWRIEGGRAVRIAYEIYGGPEGERPLVAGLMPNTEFGMEIYVSLAYLVYILGLSMDKVLSLFQFFWQLDLSKSQADTMLYRLARDWRGEFDALCELLAFSAVVHADETSWSINSVWAFLSENVRVLIFGCKKDAATLEALLPKEVFEGVLISDDAAVYRNFSKSQKCWAHLIRKAIRLAVLEPENDEYRRFLDGLVDVYRTACRFAEDRRLGAAGRSRRVDELSDMMCDLCGDRFADETAPATETEKDYKNLVEELVRLLGDEELFTFVLHPEASGTNNEAERSLRGAAMDRRTGRTSKTINGARRRTILVSVLESLRLHLSEYTLSAVLAEVTGWTGRQAGRFQQMLERLDLGPPLRVPLEEILPQPAV